MNANDLIKKLELLSEDEKKLDLFIYDYEEKGVYIPLEYNDINLESRMLYYYPRYYPWFGDTDKDENEDENEDGVGKQFEKNILVLFMEKR
jgi:hypothetical protein